MIDTLPWKEAMELDTHGISEKGDDPSLMKP
jgi:hypothetical protein